MKHRIVKDSILNIAATMIFTVATQFIVYPIFGKTMSSSDFGVFLTIQGLINAFGVIFGGSLNNIKLINEEKKTDNTSYLKLLILSVILNSIIISLSLLFFLNSINIQQYIILIITGNLILLRSYLTVYYRINLNYIYILIHMTVTSIGYILGIMIYTHFNDWTLVFFIGELFSFIFLFFTTRFLSDIKKFKISDNNKYLYKSFGDLALSNSISNIMLYLDRFLLTPLLGTADVGVFYVSSLIGKMSGIVLQPISGVILTYISKDNRLSKWKTYKLTSIISTIFGLFLFAVTIIISPVFIKIFYPDFVLSIKPYYILASLGAIILILSNLLQPLTLKYCNIKWQIFIQFSYGFLYIILGIILTKLFGLMGFVVAVLIANSYRFLFIHILLFIKLRKSEKND